MLHTLKRWLFTDLLRESPFARPAPPAPQAVPFDVLGDRILDVLENLTGTVFMHLDRHACPHVVFTGHGPDCVGFTNQRRMDANYTKVSLTLWKTHTSVIYLHSTVEKHYGTPKWYDGKLHRPYRLEQREFLVPLDQIRERWAAIEAFIFQGEPVEAPSVATPIPPLGASQD